ncbi:hypothetical protein B0H11DRAFT_1923726 [Mycena galericulata]|nr:hypothetical protein B0H11DRAFT_1923726 [Mycena galericulata]
MTVKATSFKSAAPTSFESAAYETTVHPVSQHPKACFFATDQASSECTSVFVPVRGTQGAGTAQHPVSSQIIIFLSISCPPPIAPLLTHTASSRSHHAGRHAARSVAAGPRNTSARGLAIARSPTWGANGGAARTAYRYPKSAVIAGSVRRGRAWRKGGLEVAVAALLA